jgi:uncharacterized protein (TIGR03086 family)
VRLPAPEIATVTVDELVVHGWDVARSSGQDFEVDDVSMTHVERFVAAMSGPAMAQAREGLFGPVVEVPTDAPRLDRLVALAGRDPRWSATR